MVNIKYMSDNIDIDLQEYVCTQHGLLTSVAIRLRKPVLKRDHMED